MKAPLSSHRHPWPDLCDLCFIEEAFQRRKAAGLLARCVEHPERLHSAGSLFCEECNQKRRAARQQQQDDVPDWIPHPLEGMGFMRGEPLDSPPEDWRLTRAGGES